MTQGTPLLLLTNRPYLFCAVSLIVLLLATRVGVWARRHRSALPATSEDDYNLILGATLTLLGLLIGFTFSMASGRYDQRKNYEEEEANAIGTEYIRADLLPPADGAKVRSLLREFLDRRIVAYTTRDPERLRRNCAATVDLESRMWAAVAAPANAEPAAIHGLVTAGMNDVLNREGYTEAAWRNRVPVSA
jgi:hypothetical protein